MPLVVDFNWETSRLSYRCLPVFLPKECRLYMTGLTSPAHLEFHAHMFPFALNVLMRCGGVLM